MKPFKLALLLLISVTVTADEWTWAPNQNIGDTLPDFSVTAIDGSTTKLSKVSGDKGTLLVFSRSTVW